jgi:hypothetical protein
MCPAWWSSTVMATRYNVLLPPVIHELGMASVASLPDALVVLGHMPLCPSYVDPLCCAAITLAGCALAAVPLQATAENTSAICANQAAVHHLRCI